MCPCGKKPNFILCCIKQSIASTRADPSPLLTPGERRLECWVQRWAPHYETWTYWSESSAELQS